MKTTKTCTKCNENKGLDEFHSHPLGKNGLNPQCKTCKSEYAKARRKANHASMLQREQELRDKRGDELKEYNRRYREQNTKAFREAGRRYWKKNKELLRLKLNEWRRNNPEKTAAQERRSREGNINYRISCNIRNRMWSVLNGTSKHAPTLELLGCTPEHFRFHLEQQFTDGMTWDNYGDWHMDHIQPCASFDQTDPEQQKQCWHYTNYQPLWAEDNLRKSDTIINEHQTKLL